MQQDMTIGVILTRQDMKQFFVAANKNLLIFVAALYLLIAIAASVSFAVATADVVWTAIFCAVMLVFCAGLAVLITFLRYRAQMNEFDHNKNFEKAMVYHIGAQGFSVSAGSGHIAMNWADIARLIEMKSFFLIVRSPGKSNVIPKRCFSGAAEYGAFRELITANVEKSKLKLKDTFFKGFSPDPLPEAAPLPLDRAERPEEKAGEAPLFELRFAMTKSEVIKYNYLFYYTRPTGILLTVLGLLLLTFVLGGFTGAMEVSLFTQIMVTLLCVYLLIFAPVLIYVLSAKNYAADSSIRDGAVYRFYGDHIDIFNQRGEYHKGLGDFRAAAKRGPFFVLFLSKRLAYVIPERSLADKAAFEDYFQYVKAENRRLNSYAAVNPAPAASPDYARFCTNCGNPRPSPDHVFCPECGKKYI